MLDRYADRDALPVGAAREHAERISACEAAAEQSRQLDRDVEQRVDVIARQQQRHAHAGDAR